MEFIQGSLGLLLNCILLEGALKRKRRDEAVMQVELFAQARRGTG